MQELAPFFNVGSLVCGTGDLFLEAIGLRIGGTVDELEDEGTARDDTGATREARRR
jgi:hypothetical protein